MSWYEGSGSIEPQSASLKGAIHQQESVRPQAPSNDDNSVLNSEGDASKTDEQQFPSEPPKATSHTTRNNKSRQRYFGIGRGMLAQQHQVFNADDYEKKYPPDKAGEELGPSSRFYRVYIDEHEKYRFELVEGWKDNLDVLLVFAGLFSAVVTTIVVEASQSLQPDYAELTTTLLTHQSAILSQMLALQQGMPLNDTSPPPDIDTTFVASTNAKWVNGLWFTSLALSLATALIAVVAKQWLQNYMASPKGTPRDRAHLLHMRYISLEKWRVSAIIGFLPFLLHISLLLFFCGLVVYLVPINRVIGIAVGSIALACYLAYFTTIILPLINPSCAYKTPLSFLIYPMIRPILWLMVGFFEGIATCPCWISYGTWQRLKGKRKSLRALRTLEAQELSPLQSEGYALNLDRAMFTWMHSFSFSPSATSITLQVACCGGVIQPEMLTNQLRDDLKKELIRCLEDNGTALVMCEQFARASLLGQELFVAPLLAGYFAMITRSGLCLPVSGWVDILPHLGATISADLALLAYRPKLFSNHWQESPSATLPDGWCTMRSLFLSQSNQSGINDDRQKVLAAICPKLKYWYEFTAILPSFHCLFDCSDGSPPTTAMHSHTQVLAFLGLIYCMIKYDSSVYYRTGIVATLKEVVHEFGEILHDNRNGLAVGGFTPQTYVDLLDYLGSLSPSTLDSDFYGLQSSEVNQIQKYARQQVALYTA